MWMKQNKNIRSGSAALIAALVLSGTLFPQVISAQQFCPLNNLKPQKVVSLETFKRIPILNQGRIKPLDTYAESFLILLSGKKRYEKETATQWFARFLFAPRTTFKDKVFLINNPEIPEALQIEPDKKRRYSYQQLEPGYAKLQELAMSADAIEPKNRSVVEAELLRVFVNLRLYVQLSGAFSYGFQHPDFTITTPEVIEALELPKDKSEYSFFDMLEKAELLQKITEPLEKKPEASWTAADKVLLGLVNGLYFWTQHYADCPLGIIPTKQHEDESWMSPMDTINIGYFEPDYRLEVKSIRDMTLAYWSGSQLEFDLAAKSFLDSVAKRLSPKEKNAVQKFPLELLYNKLNLFAWAELFYALTFILFLFSLMSDRKWMYRAAVFCAAAGFIPHLAALVLRILIMSRPPVSNLYETFIFVGLISVVLGGILEMVNKNWLGLVVSGISGMVALFIAGKFSSDGDTMQMLVAVLNSNFWLSTHVTSITIGYAGCCVAGIMGHIYILQAMSKPNDKKRLDVTFNNMIGVIGFGLTMTLLGTALGGIWADQSWGRFWGWDPKENGALLIVIWCAILLHARISKLINPLGMAVGSVFLLIVVMWAWFGVNLLSVGLHSYGFTSGLANTLALYVIVEITFVSVGLVVLGKKGMKF